MVLLRQPEPEPSVAVEEDTTAYLMSTDVPMTLEAGLDDMLRVCSADSSVDPINYLATFLKRNNPTRSELNRRKLASRGAAEPGESFVDNVRRRILEGELVSPEEMQLLEGADQEAAESPLVPVGKEAKDEEKLTVREMVVEGAILTPAQLDSLAIS